MSIKLNVKREDQKKVMQIGARLLPDGKTWVIPKETGNINPFMKWLPKREGHIVQSPYFSLRAKCLCWNCKRETPVVALGAKSYQVLEYETADKPIWRKEKTIV
jgi:hypothetical protein